MLVQSFRGKMIFFYIHYSTLSQLKKLNLNLCGINILHESENKKSSFVTHFSHQTLKKKN